MFTKYQILLVHVCLCKVGINNSICVHIFVGSFNNNSFENK